MDLKEILQEVEDDQALTALHEFLDKFLEPAFGSLPQAEIELLVFNLLEQIGAVSSDPGVYELVSKLRVTRTKARNLIYKRELRRLSSTALDDRVKQLLKRPIIQKSGKLFVLEVENPLVSDHLRSKVQQLGHVTDGSFSPNIVKLPLDAIVALIELYVPSQEQEPVREALIAAGAPDTSFKGAVKAVLMKVAKKVASDTGEALLESASTYITPIVDATIEGLTDKISEVYP